MRWNWGRDKAPVIFGLVGTLVGVIALAVVVAVNCRQLDIPGCQDEADTLAVGLLPAVDAERYLVTTNPGAPGGLAADVTRLVDLVPAADKPRARSFIDGSRLVVERVDAAGRVVACGYRRPGRYTLRTYQDRTTAWSVGFSMVVAGTLPDVFADDSPCYLGQRIAAMVTAGLGADPPAFCAAQARRAGGADFTVLTLGSTVGICADLAGLATVAARTAGPTTVRRDPSPTSEPALSVSAGTAGTVLCHHDAAWARITFPAGTLDPVTGHSTEDEQTGFVALSDLEGGTELPRRIRPCPQGTGVPVSAPGAARATPINTKTIDVGDCVSNHGTTGDVDLWTADCTDKGSYTVIRKASGPSIPEGPAGLDETTARAVCAGSGYDTWYGYNAISEQDDTFLCLTAN